MKQNMTFAELLGVEESQPPVPAPPQAWQKLPRPGDRLTRTARRMIKLAAEAQGEDVDPDGIEAQQQIERDGACGITPATRAIINKKESRA